MSEGAWIALATTILVAGGGIIAAVLKLPRCNNHKKNGPLVTERFCNERSGNIIGRIEALHKDVLAIREALLGKKE